MHEMRDDRKQLLKHACDKIVNGPDDSDQTIPWPDFYSYDNSMMLSSLIAIDKDPLLKSTEMVHALLSRAAASHKPGSAYCGNSECPGCRLEEFRTLRLELLADVKSLLNRPALGLDLDV